MVTGGEARRTRRPRPTVLTLLGFSLYAANLLVGLVAQVGRVRFGIFHHVLYAIVFAGAIGAAIWEFHPALLLTLAALAAMPKTRPRTPWHPALAVLGALGYVPALLS
jgi:hypothetical protein